MKNKSKIAEIYGIDHLRKKVEKRVFEGKSIKVCSEEIGINPATLRNFLYDQVKCPQIMIIKKIRDWLDVKQ